MYLHSKLSSYTYIIDNDQFFVFLFYILFHTSILDQRLVMILMYHSQLILTMLLLLYQHMVFLKERKIGSIPIKVDSPAIEVTKKENIILFMVLSYSRNKIYIH